MKVRDFALERWFGRYEFTVRHQLSASDCEALTVGEVLARAGVDDRELLALRLGYTESRGDPALREAIAARYPGRGADDVVVTNAPEEAIFVAMHALLRAGDRVVVQTPCYQSLGEIARSIGCAIVPWPLRERDGAWHADLDELESLAPDARLVVVNAPHNPTGWQPSRAEWQRLHEIGTGAGARVFADEMYRGLAKSDADELAPMASIDDRALSLWGLSKSFGLPGLRIGWLVCGDAGVCDEVVRLKDYTTICSSAPGELLARAALSIGDDLFAANRARIAANAARLDAFAARFDGALRPIAPAAGPVCLARTDGSSRAWCDAVRERDGVLMVPGELFDLEDRWVRFGLGRDGFAAALDAVRAGP